MVFFDKQILVVSFTGPHISCGRNSCKIEGQGLTLGDKVEVLPADVDFGLTFATTCESQRCEREKYSKYN